MDRVEAYAPDDLPLGERLLQPIDRARAAVNRVVLRSALGGTLARKHSRVALQGVAGIAIAFALTALSPLLLFAVAPVVLGVPHLAADLRYLVIQPRWGRAARALLVAGAVPFVLVRLLPSIGIALPHDAQLEMAWATACLLGAAGAAALSARRYARLAVVAPLLVLTGLAAYRHADVSRIVFAHLHNVIAIVLWGLLFRAKKGARRAMLAPLLCAALGTLLLGAYALSSPQRAAEQAFGLTLGNIASWLAPGLGARAGVALVLTYIFLQSVHYSVWLGLIPTEAVRGEATRSFRMSLRALLRDFGTGGLVLVALFSVATVALATQSLTRTRDTYLTLAAFHGYLELAVLVVALCGRRDLWHKAR